MKVFPFRRDKFIELVLYVAGRMADDPSFGAVKLNKVLFFADFEAYGATGAPITGARYQRLPQGPAPRAIVPIQDELVRFGDARIETGEYYGLAQIRLVPLREPDLTLFDAQELEFVDRAIRNYWGMDGTTLSQISHDESKAWQILPNGQDIPYASVFLSTEEAPAQAVDRARGLAAEHGWRST